MLFNIYKHTITKVVAIFIACLFLLNNIAYGLSPRVGDPKTYQKMGDKAKSVFDVREGTSTPSQHPTLEGPDIGGKSHPMGRRFLHEKETRAEGRMSKDEPIEPVIQLSPPTSWFSVITGKLRIILNISNKDGYRMHPKTVTGKRIIINDGVVVGWKKRKDPKITIGDDDMIKEHVTINSHISIGKRNYIGQRSVLGYAENTLLEFARNGLLPFSSKFERALIEIGTDNHIGKNVVILGGGTDYPKLTTSIGNNNIIGDGTYVGSNCSIGNNVGIGKGVRLEDYAVVRDGAILGKNVIVRKGSVGKFAKIVGSTGVIDFVVPPFSIVEGTNPMVVGLDTDRLKKMFSEKAVEEITEVLFASSVPIEKALKLLEDSTSLKKTKELNYIVSCFKKIPHKIRRKPIDLEQHKGSALIIDTHSDSMFGHLKQIIDRDVTGQMHEWIDLLKGKGLLREDTYTVKTSDYYWKEKQGQDIKSEVKEMLLNDKPEVRRLILVGGNITQCLSATFRGICAAQQESSEQPSYEILVPYDFTVDLDSRENSYLFFRNILREIEISYAIGWEGDMLCYNLFNNDIQPKIVLRFCSAEYVEKHLESSCQVTTPQSLSDEALARGEDENPTDLDSSHTPDLAEEISAAQRSNIWKAVNLFHDSKIDIIISKRIGLGKDMSKIMRNIRTQKGKETIHCPTFSTQKGLRKLLIQDRPGVRRIIISEKGVWPEIEKLAIAEPELFRNIRVINIVLPDKYGAPISDKKAMREDKKTEHRKRIIMIAILARLLESGKTPIIRGLLADMLKEHLDPNIDMDTFLGELEKPEDEVGDEHVKQRVIDFLGYAISLIEKLAEEYEARETFWKYA